MFDRKTIDKIRSSSAAMEKAGKLSPYVMGLIYKHKLFKLFVPKEAGGAMLALPVALQTFDDASYIDGNLGWAITIGSGGGYFYAYMPPVTARKIFSPATSVIAGSGHPTATAVRVKGGYKVTGQWKYASGAPYATSFTANALLKGSSKWLSFTFSPKQVSIIKDWNAMGMRATESYSFKADAAFVPDEMTFDLSRKEPYYKASIYQYPFLPFAEASFAAVALGLGRHFTEVAQSLMKNYQKLWGHTSARYTFANNKLQNANRELHEARQKFYAVTTKSWKQVVSKDRLDEKIQSEVSKTCKQSSRVVLHCADELMQYMGMQAVMNDSTINRIWRDIHTACQHVLLVPFE